jgi:hypothetical protein
MTSGRRIFREAMVPKYLLVELFDEAGRHTRAAVGMAELPFDIAV